MTNTDIQVEKTALQQEWKHSRPLTACHWSADSKFVFFGAEDHLLHRYDLESKEVASFAAHDSWIRSVTTSPDGKRVYSAGFDGRVIVWDAHDPAKSPIQTIEAHDGWVRAIQRNEDGSLLATCGNDLLVKVWDAHTGEKLHEFAGHDSHVYNVIFVENGSDAQVLSADLKGVVRSWSLGDGPSKEVTTAEALHKYDTTFRADIGGARGIAVQPDGQIVALSGITKVTNAFAGVGEVAIALVDLAQSKVSLVLESKDKTGGTMWGVGHLKHQDLWVGLSGGRGGGWLFFWKPAEKNEFFKLKLKSSGRGMALSPDQRNVAVAHADGFLRVYRMHEA